MFGSRFLAGESVVLNMAYTQVFSIILANQTLGGAMLEVTKPNEPITMKKG